MYWCGLKSGGAICSSSLNHGLSKACHPSVARLEVRSPSTRVLESLAPLELICWVPCVPFVFPHLIHISINSSSAATSSIGANLLMVACIPFVFHLWSTFLFLLSRFTAKAITDELGVGGVFFASRMVVSDGSIVNGFVAGCASGTMVPDMVVAFLWGQHRNWSLLSTLPIALLLPAAAVVHSAYDICDVWIVSQSSP